MAKTLKGRLKLTPAPPDHRIYSNGFVLGGKVHKASPATSSKPFDARGRGLPHQYPWIDCVDDPRLSGSSEDDEDT